MSTNVNEAIREIEEHLSMLHKVKEHFPDAYQYQLGEHTLYVTSKAWEHVKQVRFFPHARDRLISGGTVWFQVVMDEQSLPVFTPDPISIELFIEALNRGFTVPEIIAKNRERYEKLHPSSVDGY